GPRPGRDLARARGSIRIALPGKAEQRGLPRRHPLPCRHVAVVVAEPSQHRTLPRPVLRFEEEIGSPRDLDAVLLRPLVDPVGAGTDLTVLLRTFRSGEGVVAVGEGLYREPDAALGKQRDRRLVGQMAVLGGLYAGFRR